MKNKVITEPRVYLVGRQMLDQDMFDAFLDDEGLAFKTDTDIPAEVIAEAAGRTCYMSFGKGRKTNAEYLERIISSHHGSVLEHAVWNFLVTGISRSLTHELIRHRAGFGYCLAGDTLVYSERHYGKKNDGTKRRNGARKRRIEDIFNMTKTSHGRSRLKLMRLRCVDEENGLFTTGKIKNVVCSGKKPIFEVKLEDGKSISCSKDHRFLTFDGWKALNQIAGGLSLSPGGIATHGPLATEIMVNGTPAYKDKSWLKGRYYADGLSQETIADLAGVSKHTIRSWIRKYGLQKELGSWTIGISPWNKGRKYKAGWKHNEETKAHLSAQKRGERNPQWRGGITCQAVAIRRPVESLKDNIFERDEYTCMWCGKHSKQLTVHHVMPIWASSELACDEDNLVTLCRDCHFKINGKELECADWFGTGLRSKKMQGKKLGKGRSLVPRPRKIVSITYVGEKMTYDIEMETHHNFVANGIVTHNSQLSQRYVDESEAHYVCPPLYRDNEELYAKWLSAIEAAHSTYIDLVEATDPYVEEMYPAMTKTDRRKIVRQSARSVLPNACETKIFITANGRALRHFFEMRGSSHADTEIRELALTMFRLVKEEGPNIFADMDVILDDGVEVIDVVHSKV